MLLHGSGSELMRFVQMKRKKGERGEASRSRKGPRAAVSFVVQHTYRTLKTVVNGKEEEQASAFSFFLGGELEEGHIRVPWHCTLCVSHKKKEDQRTAQHKRRVHPWEDVSALSLV